jgi:hypothetical protein
MEQKNLVADALVPSSFLLLYGMLWGNVIKPVLAKIWLKARLR